MDVGPYWTGLLGENTWVMTTGSEGQGKLATRWFVVAVGIWLILKRIGPWPV